MEVRGGPWHSKNAVPSSQDSPVHHLGPAPAMHPEEIYGREKTPCSGSGLSPEVQEGRVRVAVQPVLNILSLRGSLVSFPSWENSQGLGERSGRATWA